MGGGRTGAPQGCGGLSDGAEREGAAGTRSTIGHAERHGWRDLGPLFHFGEETRSLPWRGDGQGLDSAPAWCTGRLLECSSLGVWPHSLRLGGSVPRGACLYPSPGEGSVERGARTWTLPGDPGSGRAGELGAPRREALFHFPALLRFLRSVSLTSLNFTALGLRPTSPRPGEEAGAGSGSLPGPRGGPTRQGADQARGTLTVRGAQPETPPLVPPGLPGRGSLGYWGLAGGVCL